VAADLNAYGQSEFAFTNEDENLASVLLNTTPAGAGVVLHDQDSNLEQPVNSRQSVGRKSFTGNTSCDTEGSLAAPLAQPSSFDPDLTRLCSAWPALPGHIKAAILALVKAVR
jgi:hypothetical protein